jgi:hypothetical protein
VVHHDLCSVQNFGSASNINYAAPVIAIGSSSCTIQSLTDSRIVCAVTRGSGRLQPVSVTVVAQVTSAQFFYSFDAPVLYSIRPSNGPSQGGYSVTLTGLNFDTALATSVLAGSSIVTSDFQNDTYLVFTMPSGSGPISVSLVVNQQSSTNSRPFSYDPPTVAAMTPSTGPTAGGTSVTLDGNGFGVSGNVRFAGVDLPQSSITAYSPTQVVFRTPAGEGYNNDVAVLSLGRLSSTLPFNYTRPSFTSMAPQNGPPSGGTLITFQGSVSSPTSALFSAACCYGSWC